MARYLLQKTIKLTVRAVFVGLFFSVICIELVRGQLEQELSFCFRSIGHCDWTWREISWIRAHFDFDLYPLWRLSRWLVGEPRGPLVIGEHKYFSDVIVGCISLEQFTLDYFIGNASSENENCLEPVTLTDLAERRTSRGALFGDYGFSLSLLRDRPVNTLIKIRLPGTVELASVSAAISLFVGVLLGLKAATRRGSRFDRVFVNTAKLGAWMPVILLGIGLNSFFSLGAASHGLPFLPLTGAEAMSNYTIPLIGEVQAGSPTDRLLHLILPAFTLAAAMISRWGLSIRAIMVELMSSNLFRAAKALGMREDYIIARLLWRNASFPLLYTIIGSLPWLFGNLVLVEVVFRWPGIARMFVDGLRMFDFPVVIGLLMQATIFILVAHFLCDVLAWFMDPRARNNQKKDQMAEGFEC